MILGWSYITGRKTLTFLNVECSNHERWRLQLDLECCPGSMVPWITMVDFNCIWKEEEHIGGQPRA